MATPGRADDLRYRDKVHGRSDLQITRSFLTDLRSEPTTGEIRLVEAALGYADRTGEDTAEVVALEQTA